MRMQCCFVPLFGVYKVENLAAGRASRLLRVQMRPMATQRVRWDFLGDRGVMMALYRSRVMASRVKTEAVT